MIKNIIFDFGQVIVRFDEEYMTSAYVENESDVKIMKDIIFDRLYWDRLDDGTITDTEVKEKFCSRLPERLRKTACNVYDNWYRNLPFVDGILQIIKRLKANGCKIFLLSNISNGFAEGYKSVPELFKLLNSFDGLIFSAPLGMVKPNREIFLYTLEKYNLKAEESLFIDDNKNNISGAQGVGINTYLFDGNSDRLWDFLSQNF